MREIMRRDVLWNEVLPLVVFLAVVLLIFGIALGNDEDLPEMNMAVAWTMRFIGALMAILAAFGLFWRVVQGEGLERQFGFVMLLLAGLLLVDVHWSLAIALGAIGVGLIVRAIMLRDYSAASGTATDYPRT